MNVFAFLAVTFIPLIAAFLILTLLVKGLKIYHGLFACILGFVIVVPIALIQYFILGLPVFNNNTFVSLLITAILFNGVIEESVKMLALCLLPQKKLSLAAFFSTALLFGLALGSFESVIYFVRRIQTADLPTGFDAAFHLMLVRSATAVVIHTFCAGLSGLYIWNFRHKHNNIIPFLWAALLHGIYNFFAAFQSNYRYFALVAILLAVLECRIWYKAIMDRDSSLPAEQDQA